MAADFPNRLAKEHTGRSKLQPLAVMFSDGGPDVRWVGNESGAGSATNWALLRRAEFAPGMGDAKALAAGQADGTHWVPAEVDVSIRPGWLPIRATPLAGVRRLTATRGAGSAGPTFACA